MAEPTILTPIELTDAELDAVSGGAHISTHQHNSTRQSIHQSITETGGSVTVGGGSGATAFTGTITVSKSFNATNTATNTNSTTQSSTNSGTFTLAG